MRLNEVNFADAKPIDGYGPGFFRVGGQVFKGGIFIVPGHISRWDGYENPQVLIDAAGGIDVVFIGTGGETLHIPTEFRAELEAAGLGVEAMASPAACRTYNVLLGEGRRIAAALLAV